MRFCVEYASFCLVKGRKLRRFFEKPKPAPQTGTKKFNTNMEITLNQLRNIISASADIGVQRYIKTRDPEDDRIKQEDAKRYLEKMGYQPIMLKRWRKDNLLVPVKMGDSRNSAVWYSLTEIKELIFSLQTHALIMKQ